MDLKELMQRVAQGDKEAFAEIYNAYSHQVYEQAIQVFSDQESARLVVKRTFRRVYLTLCKGPYRRNFAAWLQRLANEEIEDLLDLQEQLTPQMSTAQPEPAQTYRPEVEAQPAEAEITQAPMQRKVTHIQPTVPVEEEMADPAPAAQVQEQKHHYSRTEARRIEQRAARMLNHEEYEELEEDMEEELEEEFDLEDEDEVEYRSYTVPIIIGFVVLLVMLWVAAGLMMRNQMIPPVDLGYSWFNAHLFPLF